MALIDHTRTISVTEAAHLGVPGLVADAEHGAEVIVTRRNKPVAAVMAFDRVSELERAASDLRDLALVLARSTMDDGRRISFDDVLAAYGHTRESLAALPDED